MYTPAAPPYAPPPAYGPYPPVKRRRSVPVAVAVALTVVGTMLGGGVAALVTTRHMATTSPATATIPSPPPLTAAEAQAQTCAILRAHYEGVANAIDAANQVQVADWTNPELVTAAASVSEAASGLADQLEKTLATSTAPDFKRTVTDYITGLRALSMGYRTHASAKELNGVAVLYNKARAEALSMCGIPG